MGGALLGIGEVRALLRPEFPTVSVSKLRFLEAAGLVEPLRAPSGYRKYTTAHVERLRFVLSAQRDRYLPLRVIRRLLTESGQACPDPARAAVASREPPPSEPGRCEPGRCEPAPGASPRPRRPRQKARAARPLAARPPAPADARAAEVGVAEVGAAEIGAAEIGGTEGRATEAKANSVEPPAADATIEFPAVLLRSMLSPPGSRVTRGDLLARSGISEPGLFDLERYGLLEPTPDGTYGPEALTIASVSVDLSEYGLSGRHLRPYRATADREVGLLTQLAPGLARQKGRELARQTVYELASLCVRLHGALVRQGLGQSLDP